MKRRYRVQTDQVGAENVVIYDGHDKAEATRIFERAARGASPRTIVSMMTIAPKRFRQTGVVTWMIIRQHSHVHGRSWKRT